MLFLYSWARKDNMIIRQVETQEDILLMASMKVSSKEQNQAILEEATQTKDYHNWFIMVHKQQCLARVIIEDCHVCYLTFEAISQEHADTFLKNVLQNYPNQDFTMHLYSDKQNFECTKTALFHQQFELTQHKISSTIKPFSTKSKLTYRSWREGDEPLFLEMIEQVSYQNLDSSILQSIHSLGRKKAAHELYEELRRTSFKSDLWLVFYQGNTLVGFCILSLIASHITGIGYIGVLPAHRGHRYAKEILKGALTTCYKHDIMCLIDDTDSNNVPMLRSLQEVGFVKDCEVLVFTRKAGTNESSPLI